MKLIRPIYKDIRGYLSPVYRKSDHPDLNFIEDRISVSRLGVIRGLHGDAKTYKLCTCLHGELKLVVYDLKTKEKQTHILSADNGRSILIPPYTLNGHQCLSKECVLLYKWTEYYDLGSQWSVHYNDEEINPGWLDILRCGPIIVSDRDASAPRLKELKWNV